MTDEFDNDQQDEESGEDMAAVQARIDALQAELQALSLEKLMVLTRRKLIEQLTIKVELGMASHQEQAILRNLLKDNGMTLVPVNDPEYEKSREEAVAQGNDAPSDGGGLFAGLPSFDDDEEGDYIQ